MNEQQFLGHGILDFIRHPLSVIKADYSFEKFKFSLETFIFLPGSVLLKIGPSYDVFDKFGPFFAKHPLLDFFCKDLASTCQSGYEIKLINLTFETPILSLDKGSEGIVNYIQLLFFC